MNPMKRIVFLFPVLWWVASCTSDTFLEPTPIDVQLEQALKAAGDGTLDYWKLPDPDDLDKIPQDPKNPLTPEKVHLGKLLFYETGLGQLALRPEGKETFSCATCHVPEAGFTPNNIQGVADGAVGFGNLGEGRHMMPTYRPEEADVQGTRPLSVLNVAYVQNTLWNGQFGANHNNVGTEDRWALDSATLVNFKGYYGLEAQNIEGFKLHRMAINHPKVLDTFGYRQLFDLAFPDWPEEERYSHETGSLAISAYLRTLLTNDAPFQRWLKGELDAMTQQEKRGALLFFTDAGCANCHTGPALNNNAYFAIGVKGIYQTSAPLATDVNDKRNLGRGGFTGRPEDMYKFQVPQLYNLKHAGFYFHGASKRSLREVVEYFNEGVPENPDVPLSQIAPTFRPLHLTEQEIEDLTAFLENALYDPNLVEKYVPDAVLSGYCFPNNDPVSRQDLGCE